MDAPHESADAINALCVMDYDFDKQNEIIVGNYQNLLTCYKYSEDKNKHRDWFSLTLESPIMSMLAADIYNVIIIRLTIR